MTAGPSVPAGAMGATEVTTYVVLLRGINVGRHKRIAMADLRGTLQGAGYAGVRTHLQSGNVVLTSDRTADELARDVEERVADELGHTVGVVVRTAAELGDVVRRNPMGEPPDGSRFLVTFLAAKPDPGWVAELEAMDTAPDRLWCRGQEVYAWHPGGLLESTVDPAVWRRVGVTATARNWNTVTRLASLAGV